MQQTVDCNPLSMASSTQVADMLASMAKIELSPGQRETIIKIVGGLSEGAMIRDFLNACDVESCHQLGISQDQLDSIQPLLRALIPFQTESRNGAFFLETL